MINQFGSYYIVIIAVKNYSATQRTSLGPLVFLIYLYIYSILGN